MEASSDFKKVEPTKSEYIFTYVLFYTFGVVTVIPSNFFSTATDYWMYKFKDPNTNLTNQTTGMQAQFVANFTIVVNVGYVLFIALSIRLLKDRISEFYRIIGCLAIVIAIFIFTCIFVRVDTDSWQYGFYVLTLITGFFLNGFCGVFMVTSIKTAIKFPMNFITTIFSGQSICGIMAALVQIFALGVGGEPRNTGLIYFLIGLLFIFCTLVFFLASMKKNEFFSHYFTMKSVERKKLVFDKGVILSALKKAKFYMLALFVTLGATIIVQPGVTSRVESVDKGNGVPWNDTFFIPTVNFLLYFIFDYVGREAALIVKKPTNGLILLGIACIRVALVPLIIFCNAQPRHNTSVAINSDAAYVIILLIFGVSNGYILNLTLSTAPKDATDQEKPFTMLGLVILMILSLAVCSPISSAVVNGL